MCLQTTNFSILPKHSLHLHVLILQASYSWIQKSYFFQEINHFPSLFHSLPLNTFCDKLFELGHERTNKLFASCLFWKRPPPPPHLTSVCKVNTGRFVVFSRRTLLHEKDPFTGHFGNMNAVPPIPEWGGGGGRYRLLWRARLQ